MRSVLNLVVLRVSDLDRAALFYGALGLIFEKHAHGTGPVHLACEMPNMVFELYLAIPTQPVTSSTRIGFSSDDVDLAIASVSVIPEVKLLSAPQDSEWGRRAVVVDPDGHRVELTQAHWH